MSSNSKSFTTSCSLLEMSRLLNILCLTGVIREMKGRDLMIFSFTNDIFVEVFNDLINVISGVSCWSDVNRNSASPHQSMFAEHFVIKIENKKWILYGSMWRNTHVLLSSFCLISPSGSQPLVDNEAPVKAIIDDNIQIQNVFWTSRSSGFFSIILSITASI